MSFKIYWGNILRELRRSAHLTQNDICIALKISRQNYSNLECGKVHPTPEQIAILSEIYEVDLYQHAINSMPLEYVAELNEFKYSVRSPDKESGISKRRQKFVIINNKNSKR